MSSDATLELIVPRTVRAGDTVDYALRVRNGGSRRIVLELPGRPVAFDVVIARADGAEIWHRPYGGARTSALMLLALAPGDARDFTGQWTQVTDAGIRVGPGSYVVRGVLPVGTRRPTTAAHALTIEP